MSRKKKKDLSIIVPIGDGRVEVVNFSGGVLNIKRRSRTSQEVYNLRKHKEWQRCIDYFRERCAYCLRKTALTRDHFIPRSKGGEDLSINIIPSCEFCNKKKGNKLPHTWCTEGQLERIYTYFWDFKISKHVKNKHTIEWKAIGLGD